MCENKEPERNDNAFPPKREHDELHNKQNARKIQQHQHKNSTTHLQSTKSVFYRIILFDKNVLGLVTHHNSYKKKGNNVTNAT